VIYKNVFKIDTCVEQEISLKSEIQDSVNEETVLRKVEKWEIIRQSANPIYGNYKNGKSVTTCKHNATCNPYFVKISILQEKQQVVIISHTSYALRVRISWLLLKMELSPFYVS